MQDTGHLDLLKEVDIFCQVPDAILADLLATAEIVEKEKGDILFHEGDVGGAMYLVAKGAIELTTTVSRQHNQRLALLDRGQIFGELSLFDDLPRSANAEVFVDSTLLCFSAAAFNRLLESQATLAAQLLRNIVKKLSLRLRDADQEIRELSRA